MITFIHSDLLSKNTTAVNYDVSVNYLLPALRDDRYVFTNLSINVAKLKRLGYSTDKIIFLTDSDKHTFYDLSLYRKGSYNSSDGTGPLFLIDETLVFDNELFNEFADFHRSFLIDIVITARDRFYPSPYIISMSSDDKHLYSPIFFSGRSYISKQYVYCFSYIKKSIVFYDRKLMGIIS